MIYFNIFLFLGNGTVMFWNKIAYFLKLWNYFKVGIIEKNAFSQFWKIFELYFDINLLNINLSLIGF